MGEEEGEGKGGGGDGKGEAEGKKGGYKDIRSHVTQVQGIEGEGRRDEGGGGGEGDKCRGRKGATTASGHTWLR